MQMKISAHFLCFKVNVHLWFGLPLTHTHTHTQTVWFMFCCQVLCMHKYMWDKYLQTVVGTNGVLPSRYQIVQHAVHDGNHPEQ